MSHPKHASSDHAIHELVARRWSPYAFRSDPVAAGDLRSLFEAARWAPSAFNEQPWRFIVATRDQSAEFERMLSCLVEFNQGWAGQAPVLVLGVVTRNFAKNGKPNSTASHDLGLATGNLLAEATARGLSVHLMSGILPEKAREAYGIPGSAEVVTAMAIGRPADLSDDTPEALRERDSAPRDRLPLPGIVFDQSWEHPAAILGDRS